MAGIEALSNAELVAKARESFRKMESSLMSGSGGVSSVGTILAYVLEECFERLEDEDGDEDIIGDPDRSKDMGSHPPYVCEPAAEADLPPIFEIETPEQLETEALITYYGATREQIGRHCGQPKWSRHSLDERAKWLWCQLMERLKEQRHKTSG